MKKIFSRCFDFSHIGGFAHIGLASLCLLSIDARAAEDIPLDCGHESLFFLETHKQVVTRFVQNLGTGDTALIEGALADDLTWIVPGFSSINPLAGTYDRTSFLALYGAFAQVFPQGLTYTVKNVTAACNRVAVEAESLGNNPLCGQFNNHYHFLFEMRRGKIVIGKEYADSALMVNFIQCTEAATQP